MDSKTDTPIILTESFADKTAQGLAKFFVDYWKLTKKSVAVSEPVSANNTIYRVQVGAYKNKANADAMAEELKSKGYKAVIVSGT